MKNEETVLEKTVQYQEVDYVGNYRLANLFSTLADLATNNAAQIGIWKKEYQGRYGWVLAKQTLVLKRPIKINELIYLSTRAAESKRVQFIRYYQLKDSMHENIGCIYSLWTLLDLEKRKITRPDKIGIKMPEIEEYSYQLKEYKEIRNDIDVAYKMSKEVLYSDVDVNQHMNNYRYIEWAIDLIEYDVFKDCFINELSMVFKKEMTPHTKAKLYYGQKDNYFKVIIKSEDENVIYFEMGGYLNKDFI